MELVGSLRLEAMKPDIFTYIDYRRYLEDAFAALRAENPDLSYRAFSKRAKYTSPNFLQMVTRGERNLNLSSIQGTVKALKLNRQEAFFFENLVGFDQARDFEEKNLFYQKLTRSRKYGEIKQVEKGQYEYFSQWYHPVVRELLAHKDFDGTSDWIAKRVFPKLNAAQVGKSIALLESLGLVHHSPDTGRIVLAHKTISTSSEVENLAIVNFHKAMLNLAGEAIQNFPQEQRDIRSVTLSLSREAFGFWKGRMEGLWKELLDYADTYEGSSSVYQVNMQFFPLVKESGTENDKE